MANISSTYSRPVIGGVSQISGWDATLTVDNALAQLGRNSGNMMFTESLHCTLKNSVMSGFGFDNNVIVDRDVIVLAAANWINEYEDFGWLYKVLNSMKLPVVLVGVGAQASLSGSIPKVKDGTLRLLKLIAERSNSISVRGDFSCDVLNHYGIKNSVVTGCPSLLLVGSNWPQNFRQPELDRLVLHATRHGFGECDEFQRYLYEQAIKTRCDILLQSESADIYYAMGKTNNPEIMKKASRAVRCAYGTDNENEIASFLSEHGLFYLNYWSWINAMSTKTFCIGTRIHGTIASLLAGTPAVLIAHDSRTLELAKSMNLPFVLSSDVPIDRKMDVDAYFTTFNESNVGVKYNAYRNRFIDFFGKNGLPV